MSISYISSAAAVAKSLQSCPTLCDPIDSSPPGSSVPGILQVRILEWVAISFSNALKWKVKVKSLSLVRLLATPWTGAYQAPPFAFSDISSNWELFEILCIYEVSLLHLSSYILWLHSQAKKIQPLYTVTVFLSSA